MVGVDLILGTHESRLRRKMLSGPPRRTSSLALLGLLHWLRDWYATVDVPEVTTLAETIDACWPAVLVFLTTGITDAATEGTNRTINRWNAPPADSGTRPTTGTGHGYTAPDQTVGFQ